uniref:RING-type domain-containing protein n=1 Tax=Biomphalaria glabrata TaxID=6526 RepID=A0A2C9JBD6_BIOGL
MDDVEADSAPSNGYVQEIEESNKSDTASALKATRRSFENVTSSYSQHKSRISLLTSTAFYFQNERNVLGSTETICESPEEKASETVEKIITDTVVSSNILSNFSRNVPSNYPNNYLNNDPSHVSSNIPSNNHSNVPSIIPINDPSSYHSNDPSNDLSNDPSNDLSNDPSNDPSNFSNNVSSNYHNDSPSNDPDNDPCNFSSNDPSYAPSNVSSNDPSYAPSNVSSNDPSYAPSNVSSNDPSYAPSNVSSNAENCENRTADAREEDNQGNVYAHETHIEVDNESTDALVHDCSGDCDKLSLSQTQHTDAQFGRHRRGSFTLEDLPADLRNELLLKIFILCSVLTVTITVDEISPRRLEERKPSLPLHGNGWIFDKPGEVMFTRGSAVPQGVFYVATSSNLIPDNTEARRCEIEFSPSCKSYFKSTIFRAESVEHVTKSGAVQTYLKCVTTDLDLVYKINEIQREIIKLANDLPLTMKQRLSRMAFVIGYAHGGHMTLSNSEAVIIKRKLVHEFVERKHKVWYKNLATCSSDLACHTVQILLHSAVTCQGYQGAPIISFQKMTNAVEQYQFSTWTHEGLLKPSEFGCSSSKACCDEVTPILQDTLAIQQASNLMCVKQTLPVAGPLIVGQTQHQVMQSVQQQKIQQAQQQEIQPAQQQEIQPEQQQEIQLVQQWEIQPAQMQEIQPAQQQEIQPVQQQEIQPVQQQEIQPAQQQEIQPVQQQEIQPVQQQEIQPVQQQEIQPAQQQEIQTVQQQEIQPAQQQEIQPVQLQIQHISPRNNGFRTVEPIRFNNPSPPSYPAYLSYTKRMESFMVWPAGNIHAPEDLAYNGFFYAGYSDCVRCHQCGLGLKSWRQGDNILDEHKKFRPTCQFLVKLLNASVNERSLNMHQAEQQNLTISANTESNAEARSRFLYPNEYPSVNATTRDKCQVTTLNYTPISTGYEMTVMNVSASTTIPVIKKQDDESNKPGETKDHKEQLGTLQHINNSETRPEGSQSIESKLLKKENTNLKELMNCKVCRQRPSKSLFLPCGDLYACEECANQLSHCPNCRSRILGTVTTFFA